MKSLQDDALLRRYLEGNGEAFAELQSRYARLVYSTCLRETGESTLAEDAAQGVFVLMSQKAKSLVGHRSLAGWLFRTACLLSRNLVRSEARRRRREAAYEAPEPNEAAWTAVEPHLHAAMERLRPEDREAILLRYLREQSLAQVGHALGLSENTARMRVNRALDRMRKHLLKSGVVISTTVLATLMEQRAAYAAPNRILWSSRATLGTVVATKSVGYYLALLSGAWLAVLGGTAAVAGVGVTGWYAVGRMEAARRNLVTEPLQIFDGIQGTWQGQMQYVDDGSGKQFEFGTTVMVERRTDRIVWTARYSGTTSVDVMTIVPEAGGRYRIENGGPQSSHRLDGLYRLTREDDGRLVFNGESPALRAEVRLTLETTNGSVRLREEYRRNANEPYGLRNQFNLRR